METINNRKKELEENNLNYPVDLLKLNYEYGKDLKSLLATIEFIISQNLNGLDEGVTSETTLERVMAMARRANEMIEPDRYENLQLFLNALPSKEEINLLDRSNHYW